MKRFLLLAFLAVSGVTSTMAEGTGTMKIQGVNCEYSTLIHRTVGPGVTYTQYQFEDMRIGDYIPYKMRTHLLTIDMTNSYNRLSPYIADDRYYECTKLDEELKRQKDEGMKPFAAVNGIGFVQSRPSKGEACEYMESMYHLVNQGHIYYENNSPSIRYYDDAARKGHVDQLTMKAKVTSSKGASAEIGQINHFRDLVRNTNKLALFCNGMDIAKDTRPSDGVEVILKGSDIRVGTNKLEVVSKHAGCGKYLANGQHVITGVGAEVEAFLNGLSAGETITIEVGYTDAAGGAVVPSNTYTAFIANCVRNGVPYGDPRYNVAYSATGVSKDGNTVYIADLEVSQYSDAPLRCLEDFLVAVGAWNACYHDGGPSAEMAIDDDFVTNNSIGGGYNGRYIASGVMLYSTAPNDNTLSSVEYAEPSPFIKMRLGETFKLKLYGYNRYGEMIDDNAAQSDKVEISLSDNVGTIDGDQLTATAEGRAEIRIGVAGQGTQVTIPVFVEERKALIITPNKFFTCENRKVQLKVQFAKGDEIFDVDPSDVEWSTDDRYVVRGCNNGLIDPFFDGIATVTGIYNGVKGTVTVEVENLYNESTEEVDLTYKAHYPDALDIQLPSVPRGMCLEISAPETRATRGEAAKLYYQTGQKEVEKELVCKEGESTIRDTIMFDYDDPAGYPVLLKSISPATVEVLSLKALYSDKYSGIDDLYADKTSCFAFSRSGGQITLINCSTATDVIATAYSFDGTKLAETKTYLSESGSCTLNVMKKDPVIIRVQTKNGVQVFKLAGE